MMLCMHVSLCVYLLNGLWWSVYLMYTYISLYIFWYAGILVSSIYTVYFPSSIALEVLSDIVKNTVLLVAEDRKWNDEYQSIPLSRKSCQCRPRRRGRNNRCGWYRCHSRFHSGSHSRSRRQLRTSGFRSGNRGFRDLQFAMDTFKTARTIAAKHTANTIVVEGKDGKRIDKKVWVTGQWNVKYGTSTHLIFVSSEWYHKGTYPCFVIEAVLSVIPQVPPFVQNRSPT